jgi:hypothetical protein
MIDTMKSSDIVIVRLEKRGLKSAANESRIRGRAAGFSNFAFHPADSCTPLWIQPTSSAGVPPSTNIQRHPKLVPIT